MDQLKPLVVEGRLVSHAQDSCRYPPALTLTNAMGAFDLDYQLAKHCDAEKRPWYYLGDHDFGRVRITVEFLGEEDV